MKKLFDRSPYKGELVFQRACCFGHVKVFANKKMRWMTFDNTDIQSVMLLKEPHKLSLNYLRTMMLFLLFHTQPKSLLLLGLGGGSLVRFFHHNFRQLKIDAIELSSEVIIVAQQYFELPQYEQLSIHCMDGIDYVNQNHASVELLMLDMFNSNRFPLCMFDLNFYQRCYNQLAARGMLIINIWVKQQKELFQVLQLIRGVFHNQTLCVPVQGSMNIIIFAFKKLLPGELLHTLMERSTTLKAQYVTDYGLYADDIFNSNITAVRKHYPDIANVLYS